MINVCRTSATNSHLMVQTSDQRLRMRSSVDQISRECYSLESNRSPDWHRSVGRPNLDPLGRLGEVMACPDCEHVRREYLVFRRAVDRFAKTLGQLEREQSRIADQHRPVGVNQFPRR